MIPLVDIEIIIHRAYATSDDHYVPLILDKCVKKTYEWAGLAGNAKEPFLCFSCDKRTNFRKVIDPAYKSHRSPVPDGYAEVIVELKKKFRHMSINGLEADDVMGILQTSPVFGETRIVSIDKDMKTLPGWLINPDKWPEDYGQITQEDADLTWIRQAIIGDTADGFKGIPKSGPKAAENVHTMEEFFALGEEKGLEKDYLILQLRLARILRREDYDKETNTIRLWHPEDEVRFDLEKMEIVDDSTPKAQ